MNCDEVGEITTCPTQWLNTADGSLPVEAKNVDNDPRRAAATTWCQGLSLGGQTVHPIYLCELFTCFDKDELMEMPEFTITFNWASDFREKFVTMVAPTLSISTSSTLATYGLGARPIHPVLTYVGTELGTVVKTQNKAYFSIHGITYRAPTYASPDVTVSRIFSNTFTDYQLTEHIIQSTDPIVRIVKTLSRPPKGAIVMFERLSSDTSDYIFSKRYWPADRQVVRINATRAGGLIHQGTNETMQWVGNSTRRMLRSPLIDTVNEFVGKATRTGNDTALMHAQQFVKHPFLVVNFDLKVDEPQTVVESAKYANLSPDDYTMTFEFDKLATSDSGDIIPSGIRDGTRKLLIIYVYDHSFMSFNDEVTTTKIN
jgi:hypothetical protein